MCFYAADSEKDNSLDLNHESDLILLFSIMNNEARKDLKRDKFRE